MTIVPFTGEQQYRDHLKTRMANARAFLDTVPILKALVDDFRALENEPRIDNVVFWKCAYARSGFGNQPDIISLAEMNELEGFLKELDVLNWPSEKKHPLADKLRSNTMEQSLAGYTEATVAGSLAKKFGRSKLECEPPLTSGGFSDIKLNGGGQPTYIEITALNIRETERKFIKIFEKVGEYVWSQIGQDVYVHIEIDTGVLPSSKEEGIDVDASIRMITDFLARTKLISLFTPDFSLHGLKYFAQLKPDQSFYDQKLLLQHYSTELFDNIEVEPIRSFTKSVTGRDFIRCPVVYFWCLPRKQRLVEVADEEVSPSPVALLEHEAFLKHVCRKLKEELSQLQRGEINIIALNAVNWAIMHYEKGKFESMFQYEALRSRIEKFMQDIPSPDLSAVVVYEEKFSNAQVIMNPCSSGRSKTNSEFVERIVR